MTRVQARLHARLSMLAATTMAALACSTAHASSYLLPFEVSCGTFCVAKNGSYYDSLCVKYKMPPVVGVSSTNWWLRAHSGGTEWGTPYYNYSQALMNELDGPTLSAINNVCFKTSDDVGNTGNSGTSIISLAPTSGTLPYEEVLDRYCEPFVQSFKFTFDPNNGSPTTTATRSSSERCYEKAGTLNIDLAKLGRRSDTGARTITAGPLSISDYTLSAKHPALKAAASDAPMTPGTEVTIDGLPVTIEPYDGYGGGTFSVLRDDGTGFRHHLTNYWGGSFRVAAVTTSVAGQLRVAGVTIYGDESIWTPSHWAYPAVVTGNLASLEGSSSATFDVEAGETIYILGQYYSASDRNGFHVTLYDYLGNEVVSHFIKQRHMPSSERIGFDNSN